MPIEDRIDGVEITRNMRLVEGLKCEMLSGVASFYRFMHKGGRECRETLSGILANIILLAYLIARRLGMTYGFIDSIVQNKVKLGINEGHEIEKCYGDLTELADYLNRNRK